MSSKSVCNFICYVANRQIDRPMLPNPWLPPKKINIPKLKTCFSSLSHCDPDSRSNPDRPLREKYNQNASHTPRPWSWNMVLAVGMVTVRFPPISAPLTESADVHQGVLLEFNNCQTKVSICSWTPPCFHSDMQQQTLTLSRNVTLLGNAGLYPSNYWMYVCS